MSIRDTFFDAKAVGALWDVAVSLKRGNPLPIDADSVFESEAKLIEYIGDKVTTVAYPGQVVAVVNADSTQIYYIDQNLDYHEVGSKLTADGKSIKVNDNVLSLAGFDTASDGLLAQVKVDAQGNRTLNWVSIETIAEGDGNTTYTFTGLDKESNVSFTVKASDAEEATTIYLNAYTREEIDNTLTAYYNKTYIDELKTELDGKISSIPKFAIAVVNELPTTDISYTTVYLVTHDDETTSDIYDEYIYVKVDDETSKWELLGRQKLDLTGYATETFVTDEIAKLSTEGGAIKIVADELDTLEGLHNQLVDDVEAVENDVANLKAIDHDKIVSDAIAEHNADKSHLTADEVDAQIDAKLTTADYDTKISTAKQEAIDAAAEAVSVKTVSEEFTLTSGKLEVKEIAQEKITGLADAFSAVNKSVSDVSTYVGTIPSTYTETNVIAYINKKAEETLNAASGGSSESAASVLAALNTYKSENDPKVTKNTEDIASIFATLDTKLEGVKVNGVNLAITDKVVDIPAATAAKFGVVKLGDEFQTNEETGALEVKELNVNKLVQTDGDVLILDGGLATSLSV